MYANPKLDLSATAELITDKMCNLFSPKTMDCRDEFGCPGVLITLPRIAFPGVGRSTCVDHSNCQAVRIKRVFAGLQLEQFW